MLSSTLANLGFEYFGAGRVVWGSGEGSEALGEGLPKSGAPEPRKMGSRRVGPRRVGVEGREASRGGGRRCPGGGDGVGLGGRGPGEGGPRGGVLGRRGRRGSWGGEGRRSQCGVPWGRRGEEVPGKGGWGEGGGEKRGEGCSGVEGVSGVSGGLGGLGRVSGEGGGRDSGQGDKKNGNGTKQANAVGTKKKQTEGSGPQGCGPEGWGPEWWEGRGGGRGQNFALFFPLPPQFSFFPLFGVFSWNFGGVFKRQDSQVCTCGNLPSPGPLLTDRASPERCLLLRPMSLGPKPPGLHIQTCLRSPALQTPPKFHEKTPKRGKKK